MGPAQLTQPRERKGIEVPLSEWLRQGLGTPQVHLGVGVLVGSLATGWVLRAHLPEVSPWLLADAVLMVVADEAVVTRPLNDARLTPMAVPALALAVAVRWNDRRAAPAVADRVAPVGTA